MPVGREIGGITRIINLSFKLSGVKDEANVVKGLTTAANQAIVAIRTASLAWKAFQVGLGPMGWIMLAGGLLYEGVQIKNTFFTESEEAALRGRD